MSQVIEMITELGTSSDIHVARQAIGRVIPVVEALMTAMARRDSKLLSHGVRTSHYAVRLGQDIGLGGEDLLHLRIAALLHDIGKLTLPDAILFKNGPLSAEEYVLVQSHPRRGAMILGSYPELRIETLWIAHHHERWDGYGYPYGLRGNFIPLGSRILAVADTFDAIVAMDSSLPPRTFDAHVRMLQVLADTQLDPSLVQSFVARSSCQDKTDLCVFKFPS
jgi:HD-GYP domain-containing protein (c-di-GMP phosphodiesterase class II)